MFFGGGFGQGAIAGEMIGHNMHTIRVIVSSGPDQDIGGFGVPGVEISNTEGSALDNLFDPYSGYDLKNDTHNMGNMYTRDINLEDISSDYCIGIEALRYVHNVDGIIQGDGLWHPADYFNRNWDCDTVFNSDAVDINGIRAICVDGSYADIGWQPYQPQCEGNTEPNCTFEHCEYDYNNFECVTKAGHAYMTVDYPPIPGVEKYTDYYFFNGHEACSAKAYNNELYYYIDEDVRPSLLLKYTEEDNESDLNLETDPEKISEWKDDESKGSLHNMRTEKLHGKDDDEEKD